MKLLDEDADGASRQCFEFARCWVVTFIKTNGTMHVVERVTRTQARSHQRSARHGARGQGTEDGFRFQHALIVESIIQSSEEKGRRQHPRRTQP